MGEELSRLLAAGFVKEVLHPDLIANLVLVLKKSRKLWMCVDYTSLNQACPKDPFPLPRIDRVMDLIAMCELLSFLDAYSHQGGPDATTFITPFECFCYIKMPFGLKNVWATYKRCMQSCFKEQIGCNLDVCINDIIIKTRQGDGLILNLEETFTNLRHFNIRLNLGKCTFGVPHGKSLGYSITKCGIEANPNKISTVAKVGQVRNVKDVQWPMGCLAALCHFVSHLANCGLPMYKMLNKSDNFLWTDETQMALDDLKALISKHLVLASLEPGVTLPYTL
jgi:hypothetical protein